MLIEDAIRTLLRNGFGGSEQVVNEHEEKMELTVIVTHIAGTGFNSKALLRLVYPASRHELIVGLLSTGASVTRTTYPALLDDLRRLAKVEDLGFKAYKQGMTSANPQWPRLSYWANRD